MCSAPPTPVNAKQLADWQKAGGAKRQQFHSFIDASYVKLVKAKEICLPPSRSKESNRNAVFLAIDAGIEEGLFSEKRSAETAVQDTLGFWFPCPLRR